MAAVASFALRLLLPRPPAPFFTSLRRLHVPSASPSPPTLFLASRHPSLRFLCSSSAAALTSTSSLPPFDEFKQGSDPVSDGEVVELGCEGGEEPEPACAPLPSYPSLELSVKEKQELASYAHGLGKRLKSQQVGKSGVTAAVAASFVETLEANELLKLKVHGSCPGELTDVISQLEKATGSVAVDKIGRTVILYRPSVSKMKKEAEDTRKALKSKPLQLATAPKTQKKGQVPRTSSHGTLFSKKRDLV